MISIGDFSDYFSAFYTITFIAAFVVAVFTCVCNPKSKRFHKHKSFILSHDLPNEVPLSTDLNQTPSIHPNQSSEIDGNNKLKAISLHRALPDIPQAGAINASPVDNPFSNSTSFADVNSNDDVDSLYTVANNNDVVSSQNHPYARIARSNMLIDSSTENDTDDYSESRVQAISTVQCHNEPSQFRAIHEPNDTYELEPQPHILRLQIRNNIEPSLFNDEADAKKEVSYNTISVREPLSKVLAERENIEHHYNEVEDERISSFYEEITTGSATYSKINEVNLDKPGFGMDAMPSTSRQNNDIRNANSQISGVSIETNSPLYSFVDKKMKRANLPTNTSSPLNDVNNLYTKVVKSPASDTKVIDSKPILQRYSPPPPLPPPLNKETQPKLYRNTIMFGTPSTSNGIGHNYKNFSVDVEQQNIYHKITRDSEKDPGYETVYKEVDTSEKPDSNQNDYGYEAILMDESDPAYEILKPDNGYETIKNQTYSQYDQLDPNYEIIPSTSIRTNVTINMSHSSTSSDEQKAVQNGYIIDENVIIEHL